MKIKIEASVLERAMVALSKIAPPANGTVLLRAHEGRVSLTSVGEVSHGEILLVSESEDDGQATVQMLALRESIRGHQDLAIELRNNSLVISSRAYRAELTVLDTLVPQKRDETSVREWRLGTEAADWLYRAVRSVTLKPTMLSSWLPVGIRLSADGAWVGCYDNQRIRYVSDPDIRGELDLLVPVETMSALLEIFHLSNFAIRQIAGGFLVYNKTMRVRLQVPSTDDLVSVDAVVAKIASASGESYVTLEFPKSEATEFLANARSVLGRERAEIRFSGGKTVMSVATVSGRVSRKIGAEGPKFQIDLEYFSELATKSGPEIVLRVVGESFLSADLESGSIIVSLNQ